MDGSTGKGRRNENEIGFWHELAKSGNFPPELFADIDLLSLRNADGETVAHALVENGTIPSEELTFHSLRLKTPDGWSVAHSSVLRGADAWLTLLDEGELVETLALSSNSGDVVGLMLGEKRLRALADAGRLYPSVLRVCDHLGRSVAHRCGRFGVDFASGLDAGELSEILSLKDSFGRSAALACAGHPACKLAFLMDEETLLSADRRGETPAHRLARHGNLPRERMSARVLLASTADGLTVAHLVAACAPERFPRGVLSAGKLASLRCRELIERGFGREDDDRGIGADTLVRARIRRGTTPAEILMRNARAGLSEEDEIELEELRADEEDRCARGIERERWDTRW